MYRRVGLSAATPGAADLVRAAAIRYGVDPDLALAVARQESGYDQGVISSAGAIGVMQLMPRTAAGLNVDPYSLESNIDGGVRYLSQLLKSYGGDTEKALWAYNAGPGNVQRGIFPAETQNYISRILGFLRPSSASSAEAVDATPDLSVGNVFGEGDSSTFSWLPWAAVGLLGFVLLWRR
jgi:hypothetical protein